MKKILLVVGSLLLGCFVFYAAGPSPDKPSFTFELPLIDTDLPNLKKAIAQKESIVPGIKPGNEAEVIYANDSLPSKTEYAVVYLHGYSASKFEGEPTHRNFAKKYGCNLYLARLKSHGIQSENAMQDISAENLLETVNDAIAVGKKLGDKVIIMSTSTGGTLSILEAAYSDNVHALILYSPNIAVADPKSALLSKPWGLQIARTILKGDHYEFMADSLSKGYWTHRYRIEALISLQNIIDWGMTKKTFRAVNCPVFMGYYFKDENHHDNVVSVDRMLEFYGQISTPQKLKRKFNFVDAGDHVIANYHKSKTSEQVFIETCKFAEEVIGLKPVK